MPRRYVDPWKRGDSLQPFLAEGARIYGFALGANNERLTELVDRYLNEPSGDSVNYTPLAHVYVTFAYIRRLQPVLPSCRKLGWTDEMEVAFWVPLYRGATASFSMFIPYIFVDRSMAMLQGRELYGFPKQMASFESMDTSVPDLDPEQAAPPPSEGDGINIVSPFAAERQRLVDIFQRTDVEPAGIRVHAFGLKTFAADQQWRPYQLIELRAPESHGKGDLFNGAFGYETLSGQVRRQLVGNGLDDKLGDLFAEATGIFPFSTRAVFLKQLPGAENSSVPDYQTIVETSFEIAEFHKGGTLETPYALSITRSETHPILEDLGLEPDEESGMLEPTLAWWSDLDFRLEPGRIIWP